MKRLNFINAGGKSYSRTRLTFSVLVKEVFNQIQLLNQQFNALIRHQLQ
jgi:hypothetical protein